MAKANIQRVMEMLDPEVCARTYELPNIMAREAFETPTEPVRDFDHLIDIAGEYYLHHLRRVIGNPNYDPEYTQTFARGMVFDIIDKGFPGGREAAFKAATRGMAGGLPAILDCIRDHFMKQQEQQWFEHTILESVDIMDLEDIEALMQQYLNRYGRHLDGENMQSARFLTMKYREILRAHAQIVRQVRLQYGR